MRLAVLKSCLGEEPGNYYLYSLMLYHLFLFYSNEAEESDINKKVKHEYNIYYKLALHLHEFIDHTHYVYNSESCIISNHEFFMN